MENKSSNGWKFFALLFGGLLAALVGLYIYKRSVGGAVGEQLLAGRPGSE